MGSQDTTRTQGVSELPEGSPAPDEATGRQQDPETGIRGYPRPQLRRAGWRSLNGTWDFALDPLARWSVPSEVSWSARIRVPFAPETDRSGIADTSFYRACWYRRTFEPPTLGAQERLVLHFGAVDHAATVWVNGSRCAHHEGGYTPFKVDITDLLHRDGPQEIVVRAEDDPHDLAKPRGKQDWQLEPHSIWYPRTTGIWQTVWLERVPVTRIESLRWTANLARWELGLEAHIEGTRPEGLRLDVVLSVEDTRISCPARCSWRTRLADACATSSPRMPGCWPP